MSAAAKRFLFAGVGVLLIVVALLCFAPSGSHRFRAQSLVTTMPYASGLFARSFENQVVRTVPGVLQLRLLPLMNTMPGPGVTVITNGVGIQIIVTGPTGPDAERIANEAATNVCRMVATNYGINGVIAIRAVGARRYSFFRDTFQPKIARLFKR